MLAIDNERSEFAIGKTMENSINLIVITSNQSIIFIKRHKSSKYPIVNYWGTQ